MAFAFDSLSVLLLFAASIAAWRLSAASRASARIQIRFAAILFCALAAACLLDWFGFAAGDLGALAPVVALLSLSLGGTALALGLFAALGSGPVPPMAAALGLMLALFAGLAAALAAIPAYALFAALLALSLPAAMSLSGFYLAPRRALLILGTALSVIAGGFALMGGALGVSLLFFAAGLIAAGRASQAGVETRRQRQAWPAIGLG
jgi:hypothetical protein